MTIDDGMREGSMSSDGEATVDEWLLRALLAFDAALADGHSAAPESLAAVVGSSGLPKVDELIDLLVRLRRRPPSSDDESKDDTDPAPTRIGRFAILETLGRGGFGIVYRAHCPVLGRDVALKTPRPELLVVPGMRRRFLREARAAGVLDHPNIVAVLEVGEAGPLCYIASAYCKGPTLSSWLKARREPPSPKFAARLLAALADAVQHAHERGVFHRDIKPSNVILTGLPENEARSGESNDAASTCKLAERGGAAGSKSCERPREGSPVPRLTDFGLARILDEQSDETRPGFPLGSPPYMSPEQAMGKDHGVSPTTDVYGLGAAFYEVLTGRPPFRGETTTETLRLVKEAEPVSPRALRPGLPRDLETICLKCLEKDPERRYPTARELADDLHRHLNHEPILARPASFRTRALKWVRRRPAVAGAALSFAILVSGLVGALAYRSILLRSHAQQLEREAELTRVSFRLARRRLEAFQIRQAEDFLNRGRIESAQNVLRAVRDDRAESIDDEDRDDLGFAARFLMRKAGRDMVVLSDHRRERVRVVALSGDGRTLATADADRTIRIRDAETGRTRHTFVSPAASTRRLVLSPDGRRLVVLASDSSDRHSLHLYLCNSDGKHMLLTPPWDWFIEKVRFGPDGRSVWCESWKSDGKRRLDCWDVSTFAERLEPRSSCFSDITSLEAAPGGVRYALVSKTPRLLVYDGASGRRLRTSKKLGRGNYLTTISGDGRFVAIGEIWTRRYFSVWDLTTGEWKSRRLRGVQLDYPPIFSPDGRYLIALGFHNDFELHDLQSTSIHTLAHSLEGRRLYHDTPLTHPADFAYSPDSRFLAMQVGSAPGEPAPLTVWRLDAWKQEAAYPGRLDWVNELAFAPDGQALYFETGSSVVRWNFLARDDPAQPAGHADEAWSLAFSPDGKLLASGSDDGDPETIKLWDVATGARRNGWNAGKGTVSALAFDPTGGVLASSHLGDSAEVRLWDPSTGRRLGSLTGHLKSVRSLAFTPDGRLLATAGTDRNVRIWDMATRNCLHVLSGHEETVRRLCFSPDGARLVSVANDRTIRVWDVAAGHEIANTVCSEKIAAVAYSPDGRTLAHADEQGLITLRDASSHVPLQTIETDEPRMLCLSFSPDGRALAVGGMGGDVGVWDPEAGQSLLTLKGTKAQVNNLAFSPDGLTLASCSHDGAVRIWRAGTR